MTIPPLRIFSDSVGKKKDYYQLCDIVAFARFAVVNSIRLHVVLGKRFSRGSNDSGRQRYRARELLSRNKVHFPSTLKYRSFHVTQLYQRLLLVSDLLHHFRILIADHADTS